jgi:hypothetical protein
VTGPETPLDAERILRALAEHGVDYVLIGGLAVQTHGHVRTTNDADLIPAPDPANLKRLAAALRALDARVLNAGEEETKVDAKSRDAPARISLVLFILSFVWVGLVVPRSRTSSRFGAFNGSAIRNRAPHFGKSGFDNFDQIGSESVREEIRQKKHARLR